MTAFTPLQQIPPNSQRINLAAFVGYSLWLEVNTPNHPRPLFWRSLDEEGSAKKSVFLETPGFSLNVLVPEDELACQTRY